MDLNTLSPKSPATVYSARPAVKSPAGSGSSNGSGSSGVSSISISLTGFDAALNTAQNTQGAQRTQNATKGISTNANMFNTQQQATPNSHGAAHPYSANSAQKMRVEQTFPHVSASQKASAKQSAQEFESFFIYQMLELTMPETPEDFGGGFAEDSFRQLQNEFIADEMSKQESFGIGHHVYKQLMEKQEGLR